MKTAKLLDLTRDRRAQAAAELDAAKVAAEGAAAAASAVDKIDPKLECEAASADARVRQLETRLAVLQGQEEILGALVTEFADGVRIEGGVDRSTLDAQNGFKSMREFAMAVMDASLGNGSDSRLGRSAAEGGSVGVGGDGGFLVPPAFSSRVYSHSLEPGAFLPLTDLDVIAGNSMTFPRDETTPWGSTGIIARWKKEGAAATADKPDIDDAELRLEELISLARVTAELSADAVALESYLERKAGDAIRWKVNDAIINGTGAGMPLGIFNAPALVAQAKETSQTADTINANNVAKMYSRNLRPERGYWVVSPNAYPQLVTMTIGNAPIWTPPNAGIQDAPNGFLLGRPILMSDTCQTLGDQGDIYFIDFKGYKTIAKSGGPQSAVSMHLWFDRNEEAFRMVFRVDGQPWLLSAVTPPNSSDTRSHFVALAARA